MGIFFLNVGSINSDPYVAMDVCSEVRKEFILQNNFTWVKHIAVHDKGYRDGIFEVCLSASGPSGAYVYRYEKTG